MKRLTPFLLFCGLALASCSKNKCYTCILYIKADGAIRTQARQPKYCHIKKSDIDQIVTDSAKKWTQPNGIGGTNSYEQYMECTEDNYW